MSVTPGLVVTLDAADRAVVQRLVERVERTYAHAGDPAFLEDAPLLAHELPLAVRRAGHRQRRSQDLPFVLFRSPLDDPSPVGETPARWQASGTARLRQDYLLVLLAGLLGDVFGWASHQEGRIVTDILPVRGQEYEQLGASSAVELQWHTEDAAHEERPDFIGLLALRNREGTPTTVTFVDDLDLSDGALRVLREPRFHFWPDPSHRSAVDPDRWNARPVAVLTGRPGRLLLRADPPCMGAGDGDREAAAALDELGDRVSAALQDVVIGEGDCCFVDNRRAVHGRRAFMSRYDGQDRWLRRVCVARDLAHGGPVRSADDRIRDWSLQ